MRLKKLGVALIAVFALSAIAVGSASAAATTTAAQVYTGASPGTTLTTAETASFGLKSGTTAVLKSKVGTSLTPIELTSSSASCSGCTLENKEVTSKAGKVAFGTGKIVFSGVTVGTPAHCAVSGGSVTTKALNVHADFMNGTTAVQQFIPVTGTSFAAFELINNGGTCAVAGLYNVTGTLFSDGATANDATGVFKPTHEANVSPAINTNDGGALTIGSQTAELTATGVFGIGSGKEWAIK